MRDDNKEPDNVVKRHRTGESSNSTFSLGHDHFPPLSGGKRARVQYSSQGIK